MSSNDEENKLWKMYFQFEILPKAIIGALIIIFILMGVSII